MRAVRSRCATALLVAALSFAPRGTPAAEPYQIYAVLPLTGSAAFLGKEESTALRVLEMSVNKAGGIAGRPIDYVIQDDQSNAQVAVELTDDLIAKSVPVILGSSFVSSCSAMAPLVSNGPVVYCLSPGIHPPPGSFVFSSNASTFDFIATSIAYMRQRGWKKVAILTSTDATGQDAERGIETAVDAPENAGSISLVDREHFNTNDLSVAAQIARIKASGAQTAILWTTGPALGTLLRAAVEGGLTIPLFTSAGNLNYAQLEGYASFIPDDLYMAAPPWSDPSRNPDRAVRGKVAAYLAAFAAAGVRPDEGEALAWDPAVMVIDALKQLGLGATAPQIRDYIAGLHGWLGVDGRYDFRAVPQRGIGRASLIVGRWDKTRDALVAVGGPGGVPL